MNDQIDSVKNEILTGLYKQLNKANKRNIEYLKILDLYHRRIQECENIKDAKEWASRMLDHALRIGADDYV
jgi:hypothetical protein